MFCFFIDMMRLQQSKEQNDRLDAENRALRERVRTLESEKKNLSDQVGTLPDFFIKIKTFTVAAIWHCLSCVCLVFVQLAINDANQDDLAKEDRKDKSISSEPQNDQSDHEKDYIHKR